MSSQTEVINVALTRLGEARILSVDDDTTLAADARAMWGLLLRAELRAHLWRFSLARAFLQLLATPPAFGFANRCALPADCLRLLQVGDHTTVSLASFEGSAEGPWAVEGRTLLTNCAAPVPVRYIRLVEDVTQWDALFASCFAYRLAMELAEMRTQSNSKDERLERRYMADLRRALRAGALETPATRIPDGPYLAARH